jgi:hypothetical protein
MSVVAVADILDVVCSRYGVRRERIKSLQRSAELMLPRHIAMYLSRELSQRSLAQIGAALLRDHTTVLNGASRIADRIKDDAALRAEVEDLEIECLAIADLRARGALAPRKTIDAFLLAEKIVRAGDRFVIQASVEEIRALAEALLASRAEVESDDESGDDESGDDDAPAEPVMLATPLPLPPTLAELIHDFLAAEAAYRRSPSLNVKDVRERAIASLNRRADEPAVLALLKAHDALRSAEFTFAERDANARFQAAVKGLERRFSALVSEREKESVDG